MPLCPHRRDLSAVLAAVVSLGVAIGLVAVLNRLQPHDNTVVTLSLLLLPLLVFAVVSGRLREIRGPGGWMATFSMTAKEKITQHEVLTVEAILVDREFQEPTERELRRHPNALKVVLEDSNVDLPICEYLAYADRLLASEVVRYVIFEDGYQRFIAMIPVASISREQELITRDGDCRAYRLVEWIVTNDLTKIARLKGFVWSTDAASFDWTRRQCLEQMVQRGLEALPVVEDGTIRGIVEKGQLVSSLMVDVVARLEN